MIKIPKGRSLALLKPELSKEWDYQKNEILNPYDVTAYSSKRAWWLCDNGHSYSSVISGRSNGRGCPYCTNKIINDCNCIATLSPNLVKEWNFKENNKLGITPYNTSLGSHKMASWICPHNHQYESIIKDRGRGHGCPYCSGKKVSIEKSLSILNPQLASEWHPTKNKELTPKDITFKSPKSVWWMCKVGHEYLATVNNRSHGDGCPYCSGHKACNDNCLATIDKIISSEWHYLKNGKLTPCHVTPFSAKKVWWIGKCGHEWKSTIANRHGGSGCPRCNKIELKNGFICDSKPEAHYLLQLEKNGVKFKHHVEIGLGRCSCDFYIPEDNEYIEVTSFQKNADGYGGKIWPTYHKNILKKKHHITKVLKAKFKFVQLKLTPKQIQYVRENSI